MKVFETIHVPSVTFSPGYVAGSVGHARPFDQAGGGGGAWARVFSASLLNSLTLLTPREGASAPRAPRAVPVPPGEGNCLINPFLMHFDIRPTTRKAVTVLESLDPTTESEMYLFEACAPGLNSSELHACKATLLCDVHPDMSEAIVYSTPQWLPRGVVAHNEFSPGMGFWNVFPFTKGVRVSANVVFQDADPSLCGLFDDPRLRAEHARRINSMEACVAGAGGGGLAWGFRWSASTRVVSSDGRALLCPETGAVLEALASPLPPALWGRTTVDVGGVRHAVQRVPKCMFAHRPRLGEK